MREEQFFRDLEEALRGEIIDSAISDNLRYYRDYINGEKAKGRSTDEILDELGDARLIARTIVESAASGADSSPNGYDSTPGDIGYTGFGKDKSQDRTAEDEAGYREETGYGSENPYARRNPDMHYVDFSKWYVKAIFIAVLVLILFLIIALFAGVTSFVFYYFWPLVGIYCIWYIIRHIGR